MSTLDDLGQENAEAIANYEHDLSLESDMTDDEFNSYVDGRIDVSKSFWNKTFNLDKIQEENEKQWLNKVIDDSKFHGFQAPYKNNRIFTSIETILPTALNSPVAPVVTEALDSDASRELARNVEDTLLALYSSLDIKFSLSLIIRHLLGGMRYGVMKYRYDNSLGYESEDGEHQGGFVVETLRPQSVVFDAGATRTRLPFLAEYVQSSGDELIEKFPQKKDEIYAKIKQDNKKSNQIITYPEFHFEYFKDGKKHCGVGWKYGTINLARIKNPYWNYEEPEANFFDKPRFPYVVFNYLTMGRYIVDDTSLTEQAAPMQNIINKRGFQIDMNADSANGGRVLNSEMVSKDDASQIVGDPNESIMVKGNVNEAVGRIGPPLLPEYVFNDKMDARNEVDNIFGTHAPLKGAGSNSKTLGQEEISQNQDKSRISTIVECLDRGMKGVYEGLTQMICVFWDTPTQVKYTGTDGRTIHMEFDRSKIEKGIQIGIKAGSSIRPDEVMEKNIAMKMADYYDPLTLAEKMGEKNPKEIAKRIVYFRFAMDRYASEILGDQTNGNMDGEALADVKAIVADQYPPPPVPKNPTQEYISTLETFIKSGAFEQMPPETKKKIIEFSKAVLQIGQQGIKMQTAEPTNDTSQPMPGQDTATMPQDNNSVEAPQQPIDAQQGFSA